MRVIEINAAQITRGQHLAVGGKVHADGFDFTFFLLSHIGFGFRKSELVHSNAGLEMPLIPLLSSGPTLAV